MKRRKRLPLDTASIQAILNRRDEYHDDAINLFPQVASAQEVWINEAVLMKAANALSRINRQGIADFTRAAYEELTIRVIPVDSTLFRRAAELYEARAEKTGSLTDCISFLVREDSEITEAVTSDHHFEQAGFHALRRNP